MLAGKAHPADEGGKALIRKVVEFTRDPRANGRVVFLPDYEMTLARYLVQGVDVWLNTPRRPLEASGTSGMKAALNGVVNCSILDGWWAEGYSPETGFAIGGDWIASNDAEQDAADAAALFDVLEQQVIPAYYDRERVARSDAQLDRAARRALHDEPDARRVRREPLPPGASRPARAAPDRVGSGGAVRAGAARALTDVAWDAARRDAIRRSSLHRRDRRRSLRRRLHRSARTLSDHRRAGQRVSRKKAALAVVATLLFMIGCFAAYVFYKYHQGRDVRGSTTEFIPTETAPPPVKSPKIVWPTFAYDSERLHVGPDVPLRPPFRKVWRAGGASLLEFPPVIAYGRLYLADGAGRVLAYSTKTGARAWTFNEHRCQAASPAVDDMKHGTIFLVFLNRRPCKAKRPGDGEVIALVRGNEKGSVAPPHRRERDVAGRRRQPPLRRRLARQGLRARQAQRPHRLDRAHGRRGQGRAWR